MTVRFGACIAVDDVTLAAQPGEVLAIVGENGAGKSTLMNVLFGLVRPTQGEVRVDGARVQFTGARDAIRAGVGMVHQHFRLVATLSVAENIALGNEPVRGRGLLFDVDTARERTRLLASSLGFTIDADAIVGELSVGAQQRVEIMKSLARGAKTLILDEPTAVLTPQEADDLFHTLRALAKSGAAVIFISHKLKEVQALASRIAVMRAGKLVDIVAGGTAPAELARLMVGRALVEALPRAMGKPGEAALTLDGVSVVDARGGRALTDVSLSVQAGEIVGVAGVEGNGQSELAAVAAGLLRPDAGTVKRQGGATVGYVPGDRLRDAVAPGLSVEENLVLGRHREPGFRGRFGIGSARVAIHAHALRCEEELDVRPRDPSLPISALSGGNQQKAVLARELSRAPSVLVAAHPTRGVDVGAVEAIHARLLAERDRGAAILLLSSDLTEILALCDRVVVLYNGSLVHETRAADTDERKLGAHMLGAAA